MKALSRPLLIVLAGLSWGLVPPNPGHGASPQDPAKRSIERATDLYLSGDADGAIAVLHKAPELAGSAEAYHLLGQLYFKEKKKPHEAVDAFVHALKLKPAYPDALNDLAEVYLAQGKTVEAEQVLEQQSGDESGWVRGRLGKGGSPIKLRTSNGTISVR